MEHRCAVRKAIVLDVVLSCRTLGLVGGRTRDISMAGMSVDIGRIQLPVNAMVTCFLLLGSGGPVKSYRTEAMVVHAGRSGVGLMFSQLKSPLQQNLHRVLFAPTGPTAQLAAKRRVS